MLPNTKDLATKSVMEMSKTRDYNSFKKSHDIQYDMINSVTNYFCF